MTEACVHSFTEGQRLTAESGQPYYGETKEFTIARVKFTRRRLG